MTRRHHRRVADLMKDMLIYVGIACAVVGVIGYMATNVRQEVAHSAIVWFGMLVQTAIVFGYFVADHRTERRLRMFWLLFFFALAIHLSAFVWALRHNAIPGMFFYVPVGIVEGVALDAILQAVLRRVNAPGRRPATS